MRVLFCGSGEFATTSLKAIFAGEHEIAGVITPPARPAGRGGLLRATAVARLASDLGIGATECEDINAPEAVAMIQAIGPDVIFVVDFGQFISKAVRRLAGHEAFNLHASLLPALRGAAPVNWALIRGHRATGVTTFLLADKMDAGAIYASRRTDIAPDETAEELRGRLAVMGAELTCRTLDMLADGSARPVAQDETKATAAPKLKKSDGWIDFAADADKIRGLVHGTWPWPGGQAVLKSRRGKDVPVTIARVAVADGPDEEPGLLGSDLTVATGRGRIRILQIKPAGKRVMDWRDFVNGYRPSEGDRFTRPAR